MVNSLSITFYITQDLYVNDQGVVQLHPFFMMGMQSSSPKSAIDHEVPMHKRRIAKALSLRTSMANTCKMNVAVAFTCAVLGLHMCSMIDPPLVS